MTWVTDDSGEVIIGGGTSQAIININSIPTGASVAINNDPPVGVTPITIYADPDSYSIVISKAGYVDCTRNITVVAGEVTSVNCTLTQVANDTGTLTVTSTPSGAEVYVDENIVGTTPYTSSESVGSHQVRIHYESFTDHVESVNIVKNQTSTVDWTFIAQSSMGWLVGLGLAGAAIKMYMDKNKKGR